MHGGVGWLVNTVTGGLCSATDDVLEAAGNTVAVFRQSCDSIGVRNQHCGVIAVLSCAHLFTGTLFASTRHTVAFSPDPKRGWVINEGDFPGHLLSFVLDSDGEHWRGIKVGGCWEGYVA